MHKSLYGARVIPDEKSSLQIDLDDQLISTKQAEHYSAFAVVRKQSVRRIFGYVYYLEKKLIDGSPLYALFGGGIEHTDPTKIKTDLDRTSASALAREIGEEIGTLGNPNGREFRRSDFDIFTSIVGVQIDGREVAADVWKMEDSIADRVHLKNIIKNQKQKKVELDRLKSKLEATSDDVEREKIHNQIKAKQEAIAGKPIRVRRLFGVWMMFRYSWAFPFPIRIRPNWFEFTPTAAYALMMDVRLRERKGPVKNAAL